MRPEKAKPDSAERAVMLELHGVSKTFYSDSGEEIRALEGLKLLV